MPLPRWSPVWSHWSLAVLGALEPSLSAEQQAQGNQALVTLQEHPQAKSGLLSKLQLLVQYPRGLEACLTLAVDEFLRFESSNQLGNRRAVRACEVGGVALPEGARVGVRVFGDSCARRLHWIDPLSHYCHTGFIGCGCSSPLSKDLT